MPVFTASNQTKTNHICTESNNKTAKCVLNRSEKFNKLVYIWE